MTLKNVNPRDCPTAGLRPRGGNDYTAESLYRVGVDCGTRVPLFPPVELRNRTCGHLAAGAQKAGGRERGAVFPFTPGPVTLARDLK